MTPGEVVGALERAGICRTEITPDMMRACRVIARDVEYLRVLLNLAYEGLLNGHLHTREARDQIVSRIGKALADLADETSARAAQQIVTDE